jgi:hypothetical protein
VRLIPALAVLLPLCAGAVDVRYQAEAAPVAYSYSREVFKSFSYDSGWQPSNSAVQVRFTADVGGGFTAYAPGRIRLGWQPQHALWGEGDLMAGWLAMNVGAEVHSRIKFDVEWEGYQYKWEGPLPYAPNFDYRFSAKKEFTPFLLAGGSPDHVDVTDQIQRTLLYSVPLTQSIIPINNVGGYLDLYARGKMDASLVGLQLFFREGSMTTASSFLPWSVPVTDVFETSARYQAQLRWQATMILEPALVLKIGPGSWQLASLPVPIPLPQQTELWDFGEKKVAFELPRVAVSFVDAPLPVLGEDRVLPLDFGEAYLGQRTERRVRVINTSRVPVYGELVLSGAGFSLPSSSSISLKPNQSAEYAVALDRVGEGSFAGTLRIDSNDPRGPVTVKLTGRGQLPVTPDTTPVEAETPSEPMPQMSLKPGCGCGSAADGVWLLAALLPLKRRYFSRKRASR